MKGLVMGGVCMEEKVRGSQEVRGPLRQVSPLDEARAAADAGSIQMCSVDAVGQERRCHLLQEPVPNPSAEVRAPPLCSQGSQLPLIT